LFSAEFVVSLGFVTDWDVRAVLGKTLSLAVPLL